MSIIPENFSSKEEYVHHIFSKIAYRYDFLNSALTFNLDKYWRRFAISKCNLIPGAKVLDVCCGTGMLSLEVASSLKGCVEVTGIDFCESMLEKGRSNVSASKWQDSIELVHGNAMSIPFPDSVFDCAVTGFALRNVPDIGGAIKEMVRVVKPGGLVVSLELSKPSWPIFKQIHSLYFNRLVPIIGKLGVGQPGPYSYLANSLKNFPDQKEIKSIFEEAGLKEVRFFELTGGIVSVHQGIVK
ncbi:MAG: demethylmenaquinone methyltransferase [Peptococcaceae bacterium]|nr:demethylmenaquinone methyltransferase [Peptococcaceae bacterium]